MQPLLVFPEDLCVRCGNRIEGKGLQYCSRKCQTEAALQVAIETRRDRLKPCGTTAAYRRHQRSGEKPCRACKDAYNESKPKRKGKSMYTADDRSADARVAAYRRWENGRRSA